MKKYLKSNFKNSINFLVNFLNKNLYKKNFLTKVVFLLSSIKGSLILIKHNYKLIFNSKVDYEKLKLMYSLPRSGTHYFINIFNSYTQLLYGIGDGIPKIISSKLLPGWQKLIYKNDNDNLPSSIKILNYSFINIKRPDILNEINYDDIYSSHHPIQYSNLIDFNKIRAIVLLREPIQAASSFVLLYLNHRMRNKNFNLDNIYEYKNIIHNRCDLVIKFFNYWNDFYKKKRENILIIKHEKHIIDTYNIWIKILEFYKLEFNKEYLLKAIDINSKENLKKKSFNDVQFMSPDNQKELKIEIQKIIKEYFLVKNFNYKEIYENFSVIG
jgi:hypothetical protein